MHPIAQPAARRRILTILILGALCTVSPFSIDMYLPAFADIAKALGSTPAQISLSVSSYFIGLAAGQLIYGPLLDRYGRKRPIYGGLTLYVLASIACLMSQNADQLIAFRFIQALGGCVASVGAFAMVRDFFPVAESAKILSLLILILGVSPLFAPTVGSLITTTVSWHWVFVLLAVIVCVIMAGVHWLLPEGHQPDLGIILRPKPILQEYLAILKEPHFRVASFAGAFAFAGLFVYVAGSPMIFLQQFGVSPRAYGAIFAVLASGFIGGSQANVWLVKRHAERRIFRAAVIVQNIAGFALLIGSALGWYGLPATFALLFLYLPCAGIAYPNAAAMALAPFSKNAGSAAALLGFIQMGIGALASSGVGLFNSKTTLPIFVVMAASSLMGLAIILLGRNSLGTHIKTGL